MTDTPAQQAATAWHDHKAEAAHHEHQGAQAIAAAYDAGANLRDLAAAMGVSTETARQVVIAGGGTLRARGGRGAAVSPAVTKPA